MPLTDKDKKYWAPSEQVIAWVTSQIPQKARVLEIGPGHIPFARADTYVDYANPVPGAQVANVPEEKLVRCDVAKDPLPFKDKSYDFIYCRHVLEDMYDPFPLVEEMSRVGKSGYIETPSPVAELGRGVDGGSPYWRGYHHHRFILWVFQDELRFVSKYPVIEYLRTDELAIEHDLCKGPQYWNTYFLWKNKIKYRHMQNPLDYLLPRDYGPLLDEAMKRSKASTDVFWGAMGVFKSTAPSFNQAYAGVS